VIQQMIYTAGKGDRETAIFKFASECSWNSTFIPPWNKKKKEIKCAYLTDLFKFYRRESHLSRVL